MFIDRDSNSSMHLLLMTYYEAYCYNNNNEGLMWLLPLVQEDQVDLEALELLSLLWVPLDPAREYQTNGYQCHGTTHHQAVYIRS